MSDSTEFQCPFCSKYFVSNRSRAQHQSKCKLNPDHKDVWNKGLTKFTNESIASTAQKNSRQKSALEIALDDDNKLKSKWINKRVNAAAEGIPFDLSYEDYLELVNQAGLKSSQLGFSGEGYVLARLGDAGGYTKTNCRFITQLENAHEKAISDKSREASRQNGLQLCKKLRTDPAMYNKWLHSCQNSEYYKLRKQNAIKHKQERDAMLDKRYSGSRNSQYGTFWITNGYSNMKWNPDKGELPDGYYRGRVV